MTGPANSSQPTNDRPFVLRVLHSALGDPLAIVLAAVTFFAGAVTTVFTLQNVLWEGLRNDLIEAVVNPDTIVAVTPFDVLFLQVRVALFVGFVLALETLVYRYWGTQSSLAGGSRLLLALVVAASFPVGAVLGYEYAFPIVFAAFGAEASAWSIVEWARLACYFSIATGVVAQISLAFGALKYPTHGVNRADAGES